MNAVKEAKKGQRQIYKNVEIGKETDKEALKWLNIRGQENKEIGISFLVFNRNETPEVLEVLSRTIKKLYDAKAVDEIVIVDSSDPKKFEELMQKIDSLPADVHKMIKIERMLPTGYAEPAYAFGLSKVSNNIILKLDADEEPTDKLIEYLKKIKNNEIKVPLNGFSIRSIDKENHEIWKKWVIINKEGITGVSGYIHSMVETKKDSVRFLDPEAYFVHHRENTSGRYKENENYIIVESYEHPPLIHSHLFGWFGWIVHAVEHLPQPINEYALAALVAAAAKVYIHLPNKDIKKERILCMLSGALVYSFYYSLSKFKYFHRLPPNEQELRSKIAEEVYKAGGVINYLGLDNPEIVEKLTYTYNWDIPGRDVFRLLLLYRFFYGKPAEKFPSKKEIIELEEKAKNFKIRG